MLSNLSSLLYLLLLLCCGLPVDAPSQDARKQFERKYPKAEDVKWNVDQNGYLEAQFKMDGEKYRADFTTDGQWIETENTIKYKNLPEAVKATIKKEYDKDDIEEVERVDHPTKGLFYDVEFKKDKKKVDIEINSSGQVIGREVSD